MKTGYYAELGAADMLTLEMTEGNRAGLDQPHTIFLSVTAAHALFRMNLHWGKNSTY